MTAVSELAVRLGFRPDDRVAIISADDLGECHAANVGAYHALREGCATSAGLMVPGHWAREAASRYRGEDVGVHLTITAEHDRYRWGPITHAPSLLDGDGGFPRTAVDAWEHADPDEVRRECRAQIERAILWGFDVSHLDSHRSVFQRRPELFDVYLDMAVEHDLPIRLSAPETQRSIGFPFRDLAADEGILFPDHLVQAEGRAAFERAVAGLAPGVTEIHLSPAVDTDELRSFTDEWAMRVECHDVLTDGAVADALDRSGIATIGYRELRTCQRA